MDKNETHLGICQAKMGEELGQVPTVEGMIAYFFPMQFRGPAENGLNTVFASRANLSPPSQRSGRKASASTKLYSE